MLNELLLVERGVRAAGIPTVAKHPDVKFARRIPTLVVNLGADGLVASVWPLSNDVTAWTLRDGQHNSFPFVQVKEPLLKVDQDEPRFAPIFERKTVNRRELVIELVKNREFNHTALQNWPGKKLTQRIRERLDLLRTLDSTDAAIIPETFRRFLNATDAIVGASLLERIALQLIDGLEHSAQDSWLDTAIALLIGTETKSAKRLLYSGGLLFSIECEDGVGIADSKWIPRVSEALGRNKGEISPYDETRICALTGKEGAQLVGNFPQPNLPVLGQTYLFAKNEAIPSYDRYARFSNASFVVSQEAVVRLAGALEALTSEERKGKVWRSIPGESPKQTDLLLAYVEAAPKVAVAESVAQGDSDGGEVPDDANNAESVRDYEKRTERIIEAVKAVVGADFRRTPVRFMIIRKLDPANRKVVYSTSVSAGSLFDAAMAWSAGERNTPEFLTMPVLRKGERKPRPIFAPHVPPLQLISFFKAIFQCGGLDRQEVTGLPASEVILLFFSTATRDSGTRQRVNRFLRLLLQRRLLLPLGSAHALRRGLDEAKVFDRYEAMRTATVIGVLLHKLGRHKETYMNEAAFKLGQLLAAADMVHVGYCADVREGNLPPSLLGNQVFTMAQNSPSKALAVLCRRWKPYEGWAIRAARNRKRIEEMVASGDKRVSDRGWDIRKAIRHARDVKSIATDLATLLDTCESDDVFRAELLLGYMAGIPNSKSDTAESETESVLD